MARTPRGSGPSGRPKGTFGVDRELKHALSLIEGGKVVQARTLIDRLLARRKRDAGVIRAKGLLEFRSGKYREAEALLDQARKLAPDHPMIPIDEALVHQRRGRYPEMIDSVRRALRRNPTRSEIRSLLVEALVSAGQLDEAEDELKRFNAERPLDQRLAEGLARVLDLQGRREEAVDTIDRVLAVKGGTPWLRRRMLLRKGRILEKLGEYDRAMDAWRDGHAAVPVTFDPDAFDARVDGVLDRLRAATFAPPETDTARTELPVMIVALPRSGTSLTERILAAHPDVVGIGETSIITETIRDHQAILGADPMVDILDATPEVVERTRFEALSRIRGLSGDAKRVVSKHLQNWSYLPVIASWFPRARVIRITRDVAATGVSIYGQDLPQDRMPWVSRLDWIGRVIRAERRFVDAARDLVPNGWFDLEYEALVNDPETQIPPLVESMGVGFDERCLAPHKSESLQRNASEGRRFNPTLSLHQVRQPIGQGSRDRGDRWGDRLDDLRRAFETGE